jgi:hypothetical protein
MNDVLTLDHLDHDIDSLVADRLDGCAEIARYVYGRDDARTVKRVYHEVRNGWIPAGRKGGRLIASKSRIKAAYLAMTAADSRLTAPAPAERVPEPVGRPPGRQKRAAARRAAPGKTTRGRARVPIEERQPERQPRAAPIKRKTRRSRQGARP